MHDLDVLVRLAADAVATAGKAWHVERHPPATTAELDRCESTIGVQLPPSYRSFLGQTNGITLGIQRRPSVRYQIILLSSAQVIAKTLQQRSYAKESFPAECFDELVVFADTMDGDTCLFDRSQERDGCSPVLDGSHDNDPDGWRDNVIAADFCQWYRNVLLYVAEYGNHDDFRYWWEPQWKLKP